LLRSEEQESLADAVRSWADATNPLAYARTEPSFDDVIRPALAAAEGLGLVTVLSGDEGGGTQFDLAVVASALGQACSPVPAVEAALAHAVGIPGDEPQLLALSAPEEAPLTGEVRADGSAVVSGRISIAVAGAQAGSLLVTAKAAGETLIAIVDATSAGVARRGRRTLDITRPIAAIELDAVAVPSTHWVMDTARAEALVDAYALHVAADAVGAATRLLDQTVDYVKNRQQFGRPVGSFQAVKHDAANMALAIDASSAVVASAAASFETGEIGQRAKAASVAAAYAKSACARAASTAIQLHGGMGFTWEGDSHVLFRRIQTDAALAGTPAWHRRRVAAALG
jgi:alkylation response protein AidB-like acyl-CoA dehydrogenase